MRKLVALDIYLHGYTFILLEFWLGTLAAFILSAYVISRGGPGNLLIGWYIFSLGVNYMPLFYYAVDMKKKNSAVKEGKPEMRNVWKYTVQQFIIFLPLVVALLVVIHELRNRD